MAQRVAIEDQVTWTVFSIFSAANALLLQAFFASGASRIVLCAGSFASFVWFFLQRRLLAHLRAWEDIVQQTERKLRVPPKFALSFTINQEYREKLPWPRARPFMCCFPLVVAVVWLVAAVPWLALACEVVAIAYWVIAFLRAVAH